MTPDEITDNPVRSVRWEEKTVIVNAEGEIDLNRSPLFQQALLQLLDKHPDRVVINLENVSYMD